LARKIAYESNIWQDPPLADQSPITHQKALDWLIPVLLTMLIGVVSWMGKNIARISESLAVVTTITENHERRLDRLESLYLRGVGVRR
jgi:cytochrome c-type biogenesis protein CcmH/NrfF